MNFEEAVRPAKDESNISTVSAELQNNTKSELSAFE